MTPRGDAAPLAIMLTYRGPLDVFKIPLKELTPRRVPVFPQN